MKNAMKLLAGLAAGLAIGVGVAHATINETTPGNFLLQNGGVAQGRVITINCNDAGLSCTRSGAVANIATTGSKASSLKPSLNATYDLGDGTTPLAWRYLALSNAINDSSNSTRFDLSTATNWTKGTAADGATAVAARVGNSVTLANASAKVWAACKDSTSDGSGDVAWVNPAGLFQSKAGFDVTAAAALALGGTNATSVVLGAASFAPSAPGGLTVGAGKNIDTTAAGALSIGPTNATSMAIGAASYVPNFPGGLSVTAGKALDTAAAGALNIGPTNATSMVVGAAGYVPSFPGGLSLAAGKSVDTTAAGALNLGPTNATSMVIGAAGYVPSFPGGMSLAAGKSVDTTGAGAMNLGPTNATSMVIGAAGYAPSLPGGVSVAVGKNIDASTAGAITLGGSNATLISSKTIKPQTNATYDLGDGTTPLGWRYLVLTSGINDTSNSTRFDPSNTTNFYKGTAVDGVSAVAHRFGNNNTLANSSAKIATFSTNGTNDTSGDVVMIGQTGTITTFGSVLITGGASSSFDSISAAALSVGGGNANSVTLGKAGSTAGKGVRIGASRVVLYNKPTAPPDCAGATLNLTVAQFLEAGIATCATAQTINLPTWQGASGIVQALPGTPAIGDVVEFIMVATAANAITPGLGTGGTNGGGTLTVAANSTRIFRCRLTNVTASSETATCY